MKNKLLILGSIAACSLFFLGGCKSGPEVTSDDAAEVALDDAGFKYEDVKDLTSQASDGGFNVSFHTPKGTFTYVISDGGIIEGRSYEKDADASAAAPASEPKTETEVKEDEDKEEESEKPASSPSTKRTAEEQTALDLALNNAGLAESDVTGIKVKMDGEDATVTFTYGDYTNVVTVDMASQTVVSTLIQ